MNIHNIIIDFFAHKMMNDINMFDVNMKLSVFYKDDCVLIIFKDYNDFEIQIVKS